MGDGLHVQELHPRSAHRVDRQEGHRDGAREDERRRGLQRVPRRAVDDGSHGRAEGQHAPHRRERDREERDGAHLQEGRPGQPGPDGSLHPASVVHAGRDAARCARFDPLARRQRADRRLDADHHGLLEPDPRHDVPRARDRRAGRLGRHLHDSGPARRRDAARAEAQRDPRHPGRRWWWWWTGDAATAARRGWRGGWLAGRRCGRRRGRCQLRGSFEDPRR